MAITTNSSGPMMVQTLVEISPEINGATTVKTLPKATRIRLRLVASSTEPALLKKIRSLPSALLLR